MKNKLNSYIVAGILILYLVPGRAQVHSPFPLDIVPGHLPQTFSVDGLKRTVYELHVTNYAPWTVDIDHVLLRDSDQNSLGDLDSSALNQAMVPAENILTSAGSSHVRSLRAGQQSILFFEITFKAGKSVPLNIYHQFTLSYQTKDGLKFKELIYSMQLNNRPVPVLEAPLKGDNWIAYNGYGGSGHRRAFNPVDGRIFLAQRHAIDWVCLGPDKRIFKNDGKANSDYYCFDAPLLAVADGTVTDLKDEFPDTEGSSQRASRQITIENAVGNYLILKLRTGQFALYAHLRKGSFRVKKGDNVKTGQVLGNLGNSGNSDEPHLHFQLMDDNSPLGSEGLPYELAKFKYKGSIGDESDALDKGEPWKDAGLKSEIRNHEFPKENAVVELSPL